jgi:hypothetical protein
MDDGQFTDRQFGINSWLSAKLRVYSVLPKNVSARISRFFAFGLTNQPFVGYSRTLLGGVLPQGP